jgi:ribonuclease HI
LAPPEKAGLAGSLPVKDMNPSPTNFKRMRFKGNKVWMALDAQGRPLTRKGKVLIKYQKNQDYEYWVHEKNLQPLDAPPSGTDFKKSGAPDGASPKKAKKTDSGVSPDPLDPDAVVIFTDGASSGNPGPSGIGVVFRHKGRQKTISRYIGETTNNVAELEAIRTALAQLKSVELPVRVFTDSTYALGVLSLGWKARKNSALIRSIQARMAEFKDLKLFHVRGHTGDEGNEAANRLAVSAAQGKGQ